MSALCTCGVVALGRCDNCHDAFCASHGSVTGSPRTSCCAGCEPVPESVAVQACVTCSGEASQRCDCGKGFCVDHREGHHPFWDWSVPHQSELGRTFKYRCLNCRDVENARYAREARATPAVRIHYAGRKIQEQRPPGARPLTMWTRGRWGREVKTEYGFGYILGLQEWQVLVPRDVSRAGQVPTAYCLQAARLVSMDNPTSGGQPNPTTALATALEELVGTDAS